MKQPLIPIPIHFKKPGRSYSQIGRKGNVALYSVYSDYFVLGTKGDALPYSLIGFELIIIKTKNGIEQYPSPWQFGKCAWSIPKSFKRVCRIAFRRRFYDCRKLRRTPSYSLHHRSPTSEAAAILAPSAP